MTRPKLAVVFPGQGAHRPGMASVWQGHPAAATFDEVGAAAGIPDLARLADDADACAATAVAQPAVFAAGMAAWRALADVGVRADVVAGHSLGEVTAAVAAGALTLEDGAALVGERGRAFSDACAASPGAMAALLGVDDALVAEAVAAVGDVRAANDNAPGQVVLAGPVEAIERAVDFVRDRGGRVRLLDVEGAFHTPAMAPAVARVAATLGRMPVAAPAIPLVSGATGDLVGGASDLVDSLVDGILATVRWRAVQERIAELGAEILVEAGPGGVLRGMARRTTPQLRTTVVDEPAAVASVIELLAQEVTVP